MANRLSVVHVSLIIILDGTALNWCKQEDSRARMSAFLKKKDLELVVLNFRGQLHCRMGGKREGPIEAYPKFWNLIPVAGDKSSQKKSCKRYLSGMSYLLPSPSSGR